MDSHVKKILKAIDKVGWREGSLVIMTTNHGGIEQKHGENSIQEVDIFLAVRGLRITQNTNIESNIINMNCAVIILKALGMEIPKWFDGKLPVEFA